MERSTTNRKQETKPATRLNHDEHELNKETEKQKYGSKGYRIAESVQFFWLFLVELDTKTKTNYKTHDNTSRAIQNLIPLDERLVPDLSRGRGRSIGGDLEVDEEGSEQMIVTLQSLHHDYVGYQHMRT
jgi:hypothetical protein